jgi:hypothetical protein
VGTRGSASAVCDARLHEKKQLGLRGLHDVHPRRIGTNVNLMSRITTIVLFSRIELGPNPLVG